MLTLFPGISKTITDEHFFKQTSYQFSRHYFALVHQVVDEAIFLPVDAMDLPGQLTLALAFVFLIDSFFHLALKVQNDFLNQFPALQQGELVLK